MGRLGFKSKRRGGNVVVIEPRFDPAQQCAEQDIRIDWFGNEVHHAGGLALFLVGNHGIGGHRNNRDAGAEFFGADRPRGFYAIHHRHLDVHQDQVIGVQAIGLGLRFLAGNAAIFSNIHHHAHIAQYLASDLLVQFIVFCQQDARAVNDAQRLYRDSACAEFSLIPCARRAAHQVNQGVEQARWRDGLVHHFGDACFICFLGNAFAAIRSEHEQFGWMDERQGLQALRCPNAIQNGHFPVQQNDVIGDIACVGGLQLADCILAAGGKAYLKTHAGEHFAQHPAGGIEIVYDKNPAAAQVWLRAQFAWRGRANRQTGGKPEGGALPVVAVDADLPAHLIGEYLGDGQPQAGAAIFARGGDIRLLEVLEQLAHLLGGEADAGVAHGKAQQDAICIALMDAHGNVDFAVFGEFDGVVGVVDEHL